jgi:hypothetical protein
VKGAELPDSTFLMQTTCATIVVGAKPIVGDVSHAAVIRESLKTNLMIDCVERITKVEK